MKQRSPKITTDRTITMGSGDIFIDLDFSPTDSRILKLRAQMITTLTKFIAKEGLT